MFCISSRNTINIGRVKKDYFLKMTSLEKVGFRPRGALDRGGIWQEGFWLLDIEQGGFMTGGRGAFVLYQFQKPPFSADVTKRVEAIDRYVCSLKSFRFRDVQPYTQPRQRWSGECWLDRRIIMLQKMKAKPQHLSVIKFPFFKACHTLRYDWGIISKMSNNTNRPIHTCAFEGSLTICRSNNWNFVYFYREFPIKM